MKMKPEIIDIEQVADLLGVSVRTVQRHIADSDGDFPGRQIGSKWVFEKQQVIEWVRGEWHPAATKQSQLELIEKERRRWGIDLPETLVDQQQHASRRDRKTENDEN